MKTAWKKRTKVLTFTSVLLVGEAAIVLAGLGFGFASEAQRVNFLALIVILVIIAVADTLAVVLFFYTKVETGRTSPRDPR